MSMLCSHFACASSSSVKCLSVVPLWGESVCWMMSERYLVSYVTTMIVSLWTAVLVALAHRFTVSFSHVLMGFGEAKSMASWCVRDVHYVA